MMKLAERRVYYQDTADILKKISFVLPILIFGSLTLVPLGFLPDTVFVPWVFATVSVCLGLTILLRSIFKLKTTPSLVAMLSFYHLIGLLTIVGVTGFNTPLIVAWIVLIISGYTHFGKGGYLASLSVLALAIVLESIFSPNQTEYFFVQASTYFLFIAIAGYVIARILHLTADQQINLKQAKERETTQREQLNTLLNSMIEAVITTDEAGVIKTQNAAALALLDTNQSIVGKTVDDIFKLTDGDNKKVHLLAVLKNTRAATMNNDLRHHFSKADSIHLSFQIAPIHKTFQAEGDSGFIIILRDITKEKSLEEERDEFISVVSHELRTPVAIAEGGLSNLLLMQEKKMPMDVQTASATSAYKQITYLASMINDLSTLSRAERGVGSQIELIDLNELVAGVYHGYEAHAKEKKLHLNIDVPKRLPSVSTSRLYLEEILQNFMTNALRYTLEGSVTIRAINVKDGVEFSVTDTGIGISKSDQKKIFNKFYRAEDYRTRQTGGTGLGLYVVHKLANKLGVEIKLQSRLNFGSTFHFILPNDRTK